MLVDRYMAAKAAGWNDLKCASCGLFGLVVVLLVEVSAIWIETPQQFVFGCVIVSPGLFDILRDSSLYSRLGGMRRSV